MSNTVLMNNSQKLLVKEIPKKGRGLFANENFNVGDVIEKCPVLILSGEDSDKVEKTEIYNYTFEWPEKEGLDQSAIVLGLISMCNHSSNPNAEFECAFSEKVMVIQAVKPIKKGEEITISYTEDPKNEKELWFKPFEC
jgi:SET domain-containing protein